MKRTCNGLLKIAADAPIAVSDGARWQTVDEWARQASLIGLIFARYGGTLAVAPPLNLRQFPVTLRVGLAALLAMALAPVAGGGANIGSVGPGLYVALLVREAAVGAVMGFAAALVFYAFTVAGQLLDAYLGAGGATERAQGRGPLTMFTYALAATIFVAMDGHHWVLTALGEGLRTLPAGGVVTLTTLADVLTPARVMLWAGVAIAAPMLAAIYAAEVALAAFDRLAPGLGLAEAATPVRWTTAFLGFAVNLPLMATLVGYHAVRSAEALTAAVALMSAR